MNATKTWICDSCGGTIENEKDGWVEWLIRKGPEEKWISRGLRLVHHYPTSATDTINRCQYDEGAETARDGSHINDLPLESFLGPDGLTDLLCFIHEAELPADEVLEMIKRLHVPGYEHARRHFDRAIANGAFEPTTPPGYYSQNDIANTLEFIRQERA